MSDSTKSKLVNMDMDKTDTAYVIELQHFINALQNNTPFISDITDAVLTQRLADAAARSYESGQPVLL